MSSNSLWETAGLVSQSLGELNEDLTPMEPYSPPSASSSAMSTTSSHFLAEFGSSVVKKAQGDYFHSNTLLNNWANAACKLLLLKLN